MVKRRNFEACLKRISALYGTNTIMLPEQSKTYFFKDLPHFLIWFLSNVECYGFLLIDHNLI